MKIEKLSLKAFTLWILSITLMSCSDYAQQIKLSTEQPILPVLTWKETNPILKITLIKNSKTKNYTLNEVVVSLQGTSNINDIESVCLFANGEKGLISEENPLTTPLPPANPVVFKEKIAIETDTFSFWLSVKLKEKVDLSHRISASCTDVKTNLGRIRIDEAAFSKPLRVGVAVRQHGQDGVHTSRIPGLATSKKGTLLAIYDARYESARDLQGDIDIALNRSIDGGQTWQPMQIVLNRKEWGGLPEKYNGVSDACILVDKNNGDIYVAGLWMHGVLDRETGKWVKGMTKDSTRWIHQWRAKGSQPGFDVKETSQFLITKSTDDGATWGEPVNITTCKKREWWLFAPAPGHGITLKDGTLVFPTQGRDKNGQSFSNITWSKNGGKTWTTSEPAYHNTTECMAVELSEGSVMLNMRDNRNRGNAENNGRRICTTNDLGKTWTEHPTSRKALIEPTCMASIHRHEYTENGKKKSLLLFVNPSSISKRDRITLKVSFDEGNSWPKNHWILLDEYSGRGYSCITSVDENTIGILYESSQADLVFQQIKLEEVK